MSFGKSKRFSYSPLLPENKILNIDSQNQVNHKINNNFHKSATNSINHRGNQTLKRLSNTVSKTFSGKHRNRKEYNVDIEENISNNEMNVRNNRYIKEDLANIKNACFKLQTVLSIDKNETFNKDECISEKQDVSAEDIQSRIQDVTTSIEQKFAEMLLRMKDRSERSVNTFIEEVHDYNKGLLEEILNMRHKKGSSWAHERVGNDIEPIIVEMSIKMRGEYERRVRRLVEELITHNQYSIDDLQNQCRYNMEELRGDVTQSIKNSIELHRRKKERTELHIRNLTQLKECNTKIVSLLDASYKVLLELTDKKIKHQALLIDVMKEEINALDLSIQMGAKRIEE